MAPRRVSRLAGPPISNALPSVTCRCSAYHFPHALRRGACKGAAPVDNIGPKRCTRHTHKADCRPGRPGCRWRRVEAGLCHCGAPHHPHRSGKGSCLSLGTIEDACAVYDRQRAARG